MMVSSSATLNNYSLLPITYPTGNIAQVYGWTFEQINKNLAAYYKLYIFPLYIERHI
jgi:hypothetical protein